MGNLCFRGNRFSEFLGEMCLGEILGLKFLGEIVLGKIFQARKFWGNGARGNARKKIPLKSHYKYFCKFDRDPIKTSPSRHVLHQEIFIFLAT